MIEQSEQLINQFSQFITREMGLFFPESKRQDLEKGIASASLYFKFKNINDFMTNLMKEELSQKQIEILASFLTVGETYFFRDPSLHHMLQQTIIPSLVESRSETGKYIRIWSAGCASGEEPYSVAMTLLKSIPDIKSWHITIIASDINTVSLKKMQEGKYTDWSFRGVSDEVKNIYFSKSANNSYALDKTIKDMVSPNYINLCKDSYPSLLNGTNAMDVILCRNVLMYFSPETIRSIIARFYDCLVDGGYLIVSPSEYIYDYAKNFNIETVNGVTVYRKNAPVSPVITFEEIKNTSATPEEVFELAIEKNITKKSIPTKEEVLALTSQGKLTDALSFVDEIIKQDKTNTEMHYLKSMIQVELKLDDHAIQSLNKTLFLDHTFAPAYIILGNIFLKKGNKTDAKKNYECAYSLLKNKNPGDILPDSAGMTVERVIQVIQSAMELT